MKKHRILALYTYMFLIILLLTNISFLVSASDTLYEYCTGSTASTDNLYSAYIRTQSFTIGTVGANNDHWITSVILKLKRTGNPSGNFVVQIYNSDVNHKPTGSILTTGYKLASTISTSATDYEFIFSPSTIRLSASTEYNIVVRCNGGTPGNYITLYYSGTGSYYAGGLFGSSTNNGSSWAMDNRWDFYFKEYGVKYTTTYNMSYSNLIPLNNSYVNKTINYNVISKFYNNTYTNYLNISYNKTCLQGYNTLSQVYINKTLVDTYTFVNGSRSFNAFPSLNKYMYDGTIYTWSINTSYYSNWYNKTYYFTFNIDVINLPVGNCSNTSLTVYNNTVNTTGKYETSYNSSTGNFIWLNFTGLGGNMTGFTEEDLFISGSSVFLFSMVGMFIVKRRKRKI